MNGDPLAALSGTVRRLGGEVPDDQVRQAAWVARCVGNDAHAPLTPADVSALAHVVRPRPMVPGQVLFTEGTDSAGVWIVRAGTAELSIGSGRARTVIRVLRPGDVDGDVPLLMSMPTPYTARSDSEGTVLFLASSDFDDLLATHPHIARRWITSIAMRLASSQARLMNLLGQPLPVQLARLLLDESVEGHVELPQRTLAAMLGVQRPSLNKVLKDLERSGWIAVRYRGIDLVDVQALEKRANRR
ncbi:Crp/Fnr family transcriptional regulator [Ruania alba]|uniref:cAMP-binding domain of CRP or a regulatory subunit of cAMP-dependent protein kinases n=1 Tax=Ruania alba TaxID=648782 RepID=A0A1H5KTN3_9MICO|nr:Crp/Fnr family transcriptional regulator [Ruania alba]SEE68060.1 cAMP-binding domain of CRP or a regulatory subunit of cAMP-dependent protein kinases [Ruania alba]